MTLAAASYPVPNKLLHRPLRHHVFHQTKLERKVIWRNRREISSSPREDGSALNAKITTLKEERNATDARNQEPRRMHPVSQLTWERTKMIRLFPLLLQLLNLLKILPLKKHQLLNLLQKRSRSRQWHWRSLSSPPKSSRSLMREQVIGSAKDVTTTTFPSDRTATCAICLRIWVAKWLWCSTTRVSLEETWTWTSKCLQRRDSPASRPLWFSNSNSSSQSSKDSSTYTSTTTPTPCLVACLMPWMPCPPPCLRWTSWGNSKTMDSSIEVGKSSLWLRTYHRNISNDIIYYSVFI